MFDTGLTGFNSRYASFKTALSALLLQTASGLNPKKYVQIILKVATVKQKSKERYEPRAIKRRGSLMPFLTIPRLEARLKHWGY